MSCPFCGGGVMRVESLPEEETEFRIVCQRCFACGPSATIIGRNGRDDMEATAAAALVLWDNRVPQRRAEIAAIIEDLHSCVIERRTDRTAEERIRGCINALKALIPGPPP